MPDRIPWPVFISGLVQVLVLLWVIVASTLLFCNARDLLNEKAPTVTIETLPHAPPLPSTDVVPKEKIEVVYKLQVEAYQQEVAAYKSRLEATLTVAKTLKSRSDVFSVVFKDVVGDLLKLLLTSLVAFAFVKVGGTIINNALLLKKGLPPEPIKLW